VHELEVHELFEKLVHGRVFPFVVLDTKNAVVFFSLRQNSTRSMKRVSSSGASPTAAPRRSLNLLSWLSDAAALRRSVGVTRTRLWRPRALPRPSTKRFR
jgi:hypothetical protein